jgi:hypothetical protein
VLPPGSYGAMLLTGADARPPGWVAVDGTVVLPGPWPEHAAPAVAVSWRAEVRPATSSG